MHPPRCICDNLFVDRCSLKTANQFLNKSSQSVNLHVSARPYREFNTPLRDLSHRLTATRRSVYRHTLLLRLLSAII